MVRKDIGNSVPIDDNVIVTIDWKYFVFAALRDTQLGVDEATHPPSDSASERLDPWARPCIII